MATKPSVYVETTFVSYLAAWPSRDLVRAAQQQETHNWWNNARHHFDLYCSELVVIEASAGDANAAADRLKIVNQLPLLDVTSEATAIADALVKAMAIPMNAARDALHIGICAVNGIQFLLTWNFKQIANSQMQDSIRQTCEALGYQAPTICAPTSLF